MKKLIGISLLFLCVACGQMHPDFQDELNNSVTQLNEHCPKMLDSKTRVDGVTLSGPLNVVYKYSLVELDASNVDTTAFVKVMWPSLLSHIRISSEMKRLRDHGVTFDYVYNDSAGHLIHRFVIKPGDYQNPTHEPPVSH